jgi:hypothetical protein
MMSGRHLFAFVLAGLAVALAAGSLTLYEGPLRAQAARVLVFGSPLVEIRAPRTDQFIPQGSVEVVVAFPSLERTSADTFRCLLNGRDVTHLLTRGENGAAGAILGAVEGENRLRVEVFGRPWWGSQWFEDTDEVTFHVRPIPSLDRAQRARSRLAA